MFVPLLLPTAPITPTGCTRQSWHHRTVCVLLLRTDGRTAQCPRLASLTTNARVHVTVWHIVPFTHMVMYSK